MTNATEIAQTPQSESDLLPQPPASPGYQHRYQHAPPTKEEEKKEEDDELLEATSQHSASSSYQPDAPSVTEISTTYYGTDGSTTTASLPDNHENTPDRTRNNINSSSTNSKTEGKQELPLFDTTTSTKNTLNANDKLDPTLNNEKAGDDKGDTVLEEDDNDDDEEYYKKQREKRRKERQLGCCMFLSGLVGVIIAAILLALELGDQSSSPESATLEEPRSESTPVLLELLDLPSSTLDILKSNPQSPQGQAFAWLRQDPNWITDYDRQRARQRFGLGVLYYATRGEEWQWDDVEAYSATFLSYDTHECDWLPHKSSFACNSDRHLTSLGLHHMGLQGPIPKEVWTLLAPETLTKVELGQNQITGMVETYIGMLPQLTYLDLAQNQLSSSLPSEIGACQSLETLALSDNPDLTGSMPTELGLLKELQGLWWMNSGASGPIPSELGVLPDLQLLELSGNELTGTIPAALFSSEWALPDYTSTSRSSSNYTLNSSTSGSGLQELRLARNRLVGPIPSEIVRVQSSLSKLDLSHNNFHGATLPSFLSELTKLTSLQVRRNPWTGGIPSELGLLSTNLKSLGLSESELTGPIPSELMQLTQLRDLYLHHNPGLEGYIVGDTSDITPDNLHPFALGLLTNLREFTINKTPFSGTLPSQLCEISILSFSCDPHTLCGCDCDCPVAEPDILTTGEPSLGPTRGPTETPTTMSSVSEVAVRESFFQLLPSYTRVAIQEYPQGPQAHALDWIHADPNFGNYSDFQRVQRFAMATLYYSLYGRDVMSHENYWLVYETHECFWLTEQKSTVTCTSLSDSNSNSTLLSTKEGDRQVKGLILDTEGIQGSLPPEIAILSSLVSLRANSGDLTGTLPTELGLLSDLTSLELKENQFQGTLPSEVVQCTSLVALNLAGNGNLNGTLPSELATLTQLTLLDVSQNAFVGRLPEVLPASLETLDLSRNRFSGPLPSELGLLAQLRVLDASWNMFSGTLPTSLGQLTALRDLQLNDNSFRGSIPSQVGSMTQLEQLLLHDNDMISGRLPQWLTTLPNLETLTVNKTFVAGRVPIGLCSVDHFNFTCSAWLCGCESCECP